MVVLLTKAGEQGLIELETEISDYEVDLTPGDLENLPTYVEVNVRLPRLGDRRDRANVILDSDRPEINSVKLLSEDGSEARISNGVYQAVAGQRLIARVTVKDTTGIGEAMYGFLDPGKRELDPEKATRHVPEPPRGINPNLMADLPIDTKDVPPGTKTLQIKITDRAAHEAPEAAELPIEIKDPAAMPQRGVIEGLIRFGLNGQIPVNGRLFTVQLESADGTKRNAPVQGDGSFSIKNLSPGEYTLSANGLVDNRPAKGSLPGVKPWAPGSGEPVLLIVNR
jgi:hypothetical protein